MKLKGSCAEFLGLYALLRHWVEVEAPNHVNLEPAKDAFKKLCEVLDTILHVKRGIVPVEGAIQKLSADSSDYLRLHKVFRGSSCAPVSFGRLAAKHLAIFNDTQRQLACPEHRLHTEPGGCVPNTTG